MYLRDFIKYRYGEKGYMSSYDKDYFIWRVYREGSDNIKSKNYNKPIKEHKVYLPKVVVELMKNEYVRGQNCVKNSLNNILRAT